MALTVLRDAQGRLDAACEWWLVDIEGHWSAFGEYVYLNQLEVIPGANLHAVRRQLVEQIGTLVPQARGVYWERRDRSVQRIHAFRRAQLRQLQEEVIA